MAQGIQAWDGAGNMVLEITDRLTRIMGGVDIVANQGGAVWVPGGGSGDIWYTFSPNSPAGAEYTYFPVIEISGDNINWSFPGPARPYATGGRLRYGRF